MASPTVLGTFRRVSAGRGRVIATAQPQAQSTPNARNDLPNPYKTIEGWAKLPEGRTWGSTSSVDIDKDGVSVWVGERCGTNAASRRTSIRS